MEDQKNIEETKNAELYLEDSFKEYIKEKYLVEDEQVFKNSTIMQMVFALEWYDIPRSAYSDLVQYHPYLTKGDDEKLNFLNQQNLIENGISATLFFLFFNNRLKAKGFGVKGWAIIKRYPLVALLTGITAFAFNVSVLEQLYLHDLEKIGLKEKYFTLDLNADMMREDLKQFGFKIEAKHFNLEETQQRLEEKEKQELVELAKHTQQSQIEKENTK